MNEDFVTYEQALKLKELGFDWECNHYYDTETKEFIENHNDYSPEDSFSDCSSYDDHNGCWNCVSAPALAQAQKWLREVKGISVEPVSCGYQDNVSDNIVWSSFICSLKDKLGFDQTADFNSYEQALSEGIGKTLELLKQQNNG